VLLFPASSLDDPGLHSFGEGTNMRQSRLNGSLNPMSRRGPKISERVAFLLAELERLYPETPVPLNHKDAFTLLVAVVLSAQCTDKRVNLTTPRLFAEADRPETMAALPVDRIRELIRPCGLAPTKAKNIQALAAGIIRDHGGRVPAKPQELEALPGVGHKTAQVVAAQAFGEPAFPVDTHIHRLAQRWGLTIGKNVSQTERDLKRLFPRSTWNQLHLRIIFFGREHCTARRQCDGSATRGCLFCPFFNGWRKRPHRAKKA
jgi:endonuclease-3